MRPRMNATLGSSSPAAIAAPSAYPTVSVRSGAATRARLRLDDDTVVEPEMPLAVAVPAVPVTTTCTVPVGPGAAPRPTIDAIHSSLRNSAHAHTSGSPARTPAGARNPANRSVSGSSAVGTGADATSDRASTYSSHGKVVRMRSSGTRIQWLSGSICVRCASSAARRAARWSPTSTNVVGGAMSRSVGELGDALGVRALLPQLLVRRRAAHGCGGTRIPSSRASTAATARPASG